MPWSPALTPAYLPVSGVRTRYLAAGDGPPLVLLHGIGRSLEDWSESVAPLSRHHRVYAPDLIGFGYTDKPDVPYSLPGLARFVAHFLDAVHEARPATLIGNSLGGAVAQRFAVQYPRRCRALVLVGSAGFGREVALGLRALTVPGLGERLLRPGRRNAERVVRALFHDPRFVTDARIRLAQDLAAQPGAARAFLTVLRSLGTWHGVRRAWRDELARRLAAHDLPTLIVWGERDRIVPARHLSAARRLYPRARAHLFPATGHLPQVERASAFSDLISDFLEEHRL
ncbi:pimeloyl-ACP methyl ester carboxylesterase [Deinobacterium chartae]|uniref:Pimeloyl-ACP methyl ester carboxylesterase n=1 Tax=Deinobacterium chartae TaxID=521158 RepID=A0A841I071_9DEIO|nr:alpha/beta fold hydrolase [Deinobacterium chartae]MBB6097385.1 pimeloyl-ACP methyl ester carboxylesterase [Deinobacterium chartae]